MARSNFSDYLSMNSGPGKCLIFKKWPGDKTSEEPVIQLSMELLFLPNNKTGYLNYGASFLVNVSGSLISHTFRSYCISR